MSNVVQFPISPDQRKVSVFTCTPCGSACFYINTLGCVTCSKCHSEVAVLEELLEFTLSGQGELPKLFVTT